MNTRAGLDLARRAGFDWIVHMDSDELLYSEKRLDDLLADVPEEVHALKFPTMEGVVDRLEYRRAFEEISLFRVHPARLGGAMGIAPEERIRLSRDAADFRRRLQWARLLGCASIPADGYLPGTHRRKVGRPHQRRICKAWVATNRFPPPKERPRECCRRCVAAAL